MPTRKFDKYLIRGGPAQSMGQKTSLDLPKIVWGQIPTLTAMDPARISSFREKDVDFGPAVHETVNHGEQDAGRVPVESV